MQPWASCSAQTTVFPRKMMVYSLKGVVCRLEGIVCSGEFRIGDCQGVGGSNPLAPDQSIQALAAISNDRRSSFAPNCWRALVGRITDHHFFREAKGDGIVATSLIRPLASANQPYPECEQQHGECWRQYAKGLRTKLIEIACGSEHISKTWFRFLHSDAKV